MKITALIALICILPLHIMYAEDDAPCVEILTMSGQVEVSRKAQDFVLAEEGAILEAGDSIRTKESSSVEISFDPDDKNISKIGEKSLVLLLLKDAEKLELMDGDIFSTLNDLPKGSSFEIRTPSALAGVRGTDWRVQATSDTTVVETLNNNAFVRNINRDGSLSSQETIIPAGFANDVKKFEAPRAVRRMSGEQMKKMDTMKADVVNRAVETRKFRKPPARMMRLKKPSGPAGREEMKAQGRSARPGGKKMGIQEPRNVSGSVSSPQSMNKPQRGAAGSSGNNSIRPKLPQRPGPAAGKRPAPKR